MAWYYELRRCLQPVELIVQLTDVCLSSSRYFYSFCQIRTKVGTDDEYVNTERSYFQNFALKIFGEFLIIIKSYFVLIIIYCLSV